MRLTSPTMFWLLAPASLALWLILVAPTNWLGFESGAVGTGLLLLTAWVGLWLSTRIPVNRDGSVSPAEVRQWVALVFTGAIAGCLVVNAADIARAEDVGDLRGVGRTVAALVVSWILFSAILHQRRNSGVQEDERDREVQRHADSWAHAALGVLVIGLAVTLGLSPAHRLNWATPIVMAHLLIFVLVMANLIGCVVAVWQYRRSVVAELGS